MPRHGHHSRGRGNPAYRANSRGARVLSREELRLLLLSLIDTTDRHGYELIRRIKSLSRGNYAPSSGMVYPGLAELEDAGLATHREADGGRKMFTATEAGIAEAKAREAEVAALHQRLESLASAEAAGPTPVTRALANLEMVLAQALPGGEGEHLDAIVDLIDDTARQIERLGR